MLWKYLFFYIQPAQQAEDGDGLGYVNGQPYPQSWPRSRPKVKLSLYPQKSLAEAFAWPTVVKRNLEEILNNLDPHDGTPVVSSGRSLKMSSNFSGICTQSRAARVLEEHQMGVSFKHVRGPFVLRNRIISQMLLRASKLNIYIYA